MKVIYNLDKVIKIVVKDFSECLSISYHKATRKTFWCNGVPEGFYVLFIGNKPYTKEELERGDYSGIIFKVIDNIVYYRPNVIIYFESENKYVQSFDSYDEAIEFALDIQSKSIKNPLIINR
jgi:hypothetical protein